MKPLRYLLATAMFASSAAMGGGKAAVLESRPQADPTVDFQLIDARPRGDRKKDGWMSELPADCQYGVYRFADDRTDPSRLAYLHDYLVNLFGKQLHGKSLEVTRYAIYLNRSADWLMSGTSGAPVGGPYFSNTPTQSGDSPKRVMGSSCPPERMQGGYYAASEVTNSFSPVVIEIEATYEGRKLRVRSVHSPSHDLRARKIANPRDGAEYFAALRDANAELAERIIDTALAR